MTDIASLNIPIDTTDLVRGAADLDKIDAAGQRVGATMDKIGPAVDGATAAVDKLADSTAKVGQATGATNGQMNDTAVLMRRQAEAAAQAALANDRFLQSLQKEIDLFGASRSEQERYNATKAGLSAAAQREAAALGGLIDALHREEAEARAVAAAQDQAAKAADAFMNKLRDQAATVGMTTQQLQAYRAAQLGVSDAAAPLIARLAETGQSAHGASGHIDGFSFASANAKREVLVLAHELSQGNFSRFGSSMMVLGEQTGAAGLLFSGAGLAALALAGSIGFVAYEMIKGASEQKKMNDSLLMTGNYAGQTSGL